MPTQGHIVILLTVIWLAFDLGTLVPGGTAGLLVTTTRLENKPQALTVKESCPVAATLSGPCLLRRPRSRASIV